MGRIVVALGGNTILKRGKRTFSSELSAIKKTCSVVAKLIAKKNHIILTHGNGPQVGDILLQQKVAKIKVPLDVCNAETQSQIGYLLQQHLKNEFSRRKIKKEVITVITQVLVDKKDPSFRKPTKPIGFTYPSREAKPLKHHRVVAVNGYRRVVPSPKPLKIIEGKIIKDMSKKMILIACGGGGIPVVQERGKLKGVEAVIDKDLTAVLLARLIKADTILNLTDVDCVYLNFRKKDQKRLKKISVKEAKQYLKEGQFPPGSMGPKIEAAIKFIESGGKRFIIASERNAMSALAGKSGTVICR